MKNIWQTYKGWIIIGVGIFFVLLAVYLNTLIMTDVNQQVSSSAYPIVQQPQVDAPDSAKPLSERISTDISDEQEKQFEESLPAAPDKKPPDIFILVN